MTLMQQLRSYLREHFNQPYCDECLSRMVQIPSRRLVTQKMSALEHDPGFTRQASLCAGCQTETLTTRASMVAIPVGSAA